MRFMLVAAVVSSIGSWIMWILLGIHYSHIADGVASVGQVGMARQIAFIIGVLAVGSWADEGRPLRKFICVQLCEGLVGLVLVILLVTSGYNLPSTIYPVWVTVRYAVAGMVFVLGFRIIGQASMSWGNGSITHFVTAQGGLVLGPLLAIWIQRQTKDPFFWAIVIDSLTSFLYGVGLFKIINTEFDTSLPRTKRNLVGRTWDAIMELWNRTAYPWNILQIFVLLAGAGIMVYSVVFSQTQRIFLPETMFSLSMLSYGLALWGAGMFVHSRSSSFQAFAIGLVLYSISGAAFFSFGTLEIVNWVSYATFFFGFCTMFHASNKILLNAVTPERVARMRASMLFYLSIIFGLAEGLLGASVKPPTAVFTFAAYRLCISVLIIAVCLKLVRPLYKIALVFCTLGLFVGNQMEAYASEMGFSENTYVRPLLIELGTFDNTLPPTETDAFVYHQVFDTLFTYGKNGELVGNLARNWKSSDNGLQFDIQLTPSAHFHDGSSLQAHDVKYSLERLNRASGYVAAAISNIKKIETNDSLGTVLITLKRPNPRFLIHLTDSSRGILKAGEDSSLLNGSGPFRVNFRDKNTLILQKNKHYHGTLATIDKLKLPVLPKEEALEQYRKHNVDDLFQYMLNAKERDSLKDLCHWTFEKLPTFRFVVIKDNGNPITRSNKFRSCIASFIPRADLASQLDPGQPIIRSYLPDGVFGANLLPDFKPPAQCDDKTVEKVAFLSKSNPIKIAQTPTFPNFPILISQYLSKHGILTKIVPAKSTEEFFQLFNTTKIDMYLGRFTPPAPDTEAFMFAFLGNSPFWSLGNPDQNLLELFDNITTETDRQRRSKLVAEAFTAIGEKHLLVPLIQYEFYGCSNPKWGNVEIPLTGYIFQDMNRLGAAR